MTKLMLILVLTLLQSHSFSQDEFPPLDSTDQVRIHIEINGKEAFLRLLQLPERAEFSVLQLGSVNGDCSNVLQLAPDLVGKQAIRFSVGDRCTDADTLVFSIKGQFNSIDYPPVYLMPGTYTVHLGVNCYILSCIPKSDPWMPHAESPYLLSEDLHYLNPKTGKIHRGKRLIHYGRFDACDLENFRIISSYEKYLDKNNTMHLGSELIKQKKIDPEKWDLERF